MKEILAGTYWLVANGDGRRAICKGRKPKEIEKSGWVIENPEMGWITLDNDIHVRAKDRDKRLSATNYIALLLYFIRINLKTVCTLFFELLYYLLLAYL